VAFFYQTECGEDVVADSQNELRAADSDRAKVADRLRVALDEGRLSLAEYDERLQQAYAAKTYGELDKLLADLPAVAPAERSRVVPVTGGLEHPAVEEAGANSAEVRRWLAGVWGAWLIVVVINVVIWAAVSLGNGELSYFWPIWVGGPWGALLLVITISGLLGGQPRRAADRWARDADRRARRRSRRQARRGY
jgi:Domain of unknown function (DUF1707)